MKRLLITAVSALALAGSFSAPASAQEESSIRVAPCRAGETVQRCAQRIINESIAIDGPCYYGEPYATCAQRIAKELANLDPDPYIDTVFYYVNEAGRIVGQTIDRIDDLCGDVFPTCAAVALP